MKRVLLIAFAALVVVFAASGCPLGQRGNVVIHTGTGALAPVRAALERDFTLSISVRIELIPAGGGPNVVLFNNTLTVSNFLISDEIYANAPQGLYRGVKITINNFLGTDCCVPLDFNFDVTVGPGIVDLDFHCNNINWEFGVTDYNTLFSFSLT